MENKGKYGGEAEAGHIHSRTTHQHTLHIANTRWNRVGHITSRVLKYAPTIVLVQRELEFRLG